MFDNKHYLAGEAITNYVRSVSTHETDAQRRLREETASHEKAIMQISPEQGRFFQLLIKLIQARHTIEIGVFTGYSSLAVALALPADGKVTACDISEEYTSVARRYWADAGVASKIDLRIAPALETLDALLRDGWKNYYDFAFIDADKASYDSYYERCLQLIRRGGVIALDNMLYHGQVHDESFQDADSVALRKMNAKLSTDSRVIVSLLPIADGITLAVKL